MIELESSKGRSGLDRAARLLEGGLPWLVFAVAAFLRFYRLDSLPPGPLYDEAYNGADIVEILAGKRPIFLSTNYGREALFIYLQALSVSVMGRTDLALRLVSAVIGLLTIVLSYITVRRLFGSRVALLSSAWLSLSIWHLIFSRVGLRSVSLPLFEAATIYCLWRGLAGILDANKRPRSKSATIWLSLSGLALGASLYTYSSARFFPFVLLALGAYLALQHRSRLRRAVPGLGLVAFVSLIVFLPEGIHFYHNPEDFFARAREISIFNPKESPNGPLAGFVHTSLRTLAMFSVKGDSYWDRNISGRPVFDPLSSALAVLGLLLALRRWRDPAHALLPLWLFVMIWPSLLTYRDVPDYLRVTGLIPALFVLPALGLTWLWEQWERRFRQPLRVVPVFLVGLAFVAGSGLVYRDYFQVWARTPEVVEVFHAGRWATVQAALRMATAGDRVYASVSDPWHPLARYALEGQPAAERVRTFDGSRSFFLAPPGVEAVYLIPENRQPPSRLLDQVFPHQTGEVVETVPHGPSVRLYRLAPDHANPTPDYPVPARFGSAIESLGYDLQRDALAGGSLDITWYWRLLEDSPHELGFLSQVLDNEGHVVKRIQHRVFTPGYWPEGTIGVTKFPVGIDKATPNGVYWPWVGIVDQTNSRMLPVFDGQNRQIGDSLRLPPVKIHGEIGPAPSVGTPLRARFGDQADLLGYDLDVRQARPGDPLTLTLYWGPRGRPSRDYTVFVHLLDSSGQIRGQGDSPPQNGQYPTSLWDAGEVVVDVHPLTVSQEASPGDYRLVIGLYEPESEQRVPVIDEAGNVLGDHVVISGLSVE